jgi:hypothetical protein
MSDNPLKQFFRRPSVYLRLPSGGIGYPEGAIDMPENGEIPVYPMTAIDEITSKTPDSLFNGVAVMEIIRSCIPNIKDPWAVTNVDLDPILVAIRAATHGSTMEIETVCPSCKETSKFDVNLTGILAGFKPANYSQTLDFNDLKIKFKPMSYKEINDSSIKQFNVQRTLRQIIDLQDEDERERQGSEFMREIFVLTVEILASTIEYIKAPNVTVFEHEYIIEFLQKCDKVYFDKIKDYSAELKKNTENKPLDITCPHCSHQFTQEFSINVSDFFE